MGDEQWGAHTELGAETTEKKDAWKLALNLELAATDTRAPRQTRTAPKKESVAPCGYGHFLKRLYMLPQDE